MAGWDTHHGAVVHLPLENVDTDQLIPARFMSVPRSEGYGDYLLHDLRRDADGALLGAFPLNVTQGSILIAGNNFGSGSSREAAVYALVDAGFKVVIAPSFGDIFASNAVNNGMLPARVSPDHLAQLDTAKEVQIDLRRKVISSGAMEVAFELDDSWCEKLINGWDDIDLTLHHSAAIASMRQRRKAELGAWPRLDDRP